MNDLPSDLRRKNPTVTLEELRERFDYNPATGLFIRKRRLGRHAAGTVAGAVSAIHGYVFISINKQLYRAHRLAWFYHYGEWPEAGFEPDHKNGNRADNRICNLRLATRSQNNGNAKIRSDNSSGFRGVSLHRTTRKWRVSLASRHLGLFETKEEAVAVYNAASAEYYGEFAKIARSGLFFGRGAA